MLKNLLLFRVSWSDTLKSSVFNPVYENDTPPPAAVPPAAPAAPPAPAPTPKTFDQTAVNSIVEARLAEAKKKHQAEQAAMLQKIEALGLTAKAKEAVEAELEELRVQSMSKEERQREEHNTLKKTMETQIKKTQEERDLWLKTYREEKVDRELMSAASAKDADVYNVNQVVDLLKPRTRLADVIDPETKKATGKLETRVKIDQIKDGVVIPLDLTPAEALRVMKEDPQRWGNLFNSGANGGLGGSPGSGRPVGKGSSSVEDMSMDEVAKYWRTDKSKLGLKTQG